MRDSLTNFGKVAATTSAATGSENIVNMTDPGKTEVTPKDCRIVFYPLTTATGTISFELKGADETTGSGTSVALKTPAVVGKYEVVNPKVGVVQKFPFPLEVKNKYYQMFGQGTVAANIEVWFEFGA